MALSNQHLLLSLLAVTGLSILSFKLKPKFLEWLKPKLLEMLSQIKESIENAEGFTSCSAEKLGYIERRLDQAMSTPEDTMRCKQLKLFKYTCI